MNLLEKINKPEDLKQIPGSQLPQLAEELREEIIRTVAKTGGHIAPSLGTVELTIALHYVFNAPVDKIVWDVGHQAYAHKLLTGRRDKFSTLRQYGGISGFPARKESEYDTFGVGHASTSISAALGMAVARDLKGEQHKVVAIIGDGGLTGGMALEALNNAGHLKKDLIVILNDNEMFISRRVGALAGYLAKVMTGGLYKKLEKEVEKFLTTTSMYATRIAKRIKVLFFPGMFFEEMGLAYIGPVNGHDINQLIEILKRAKEINYPVVVHIYTKKGKGYAPAENNPEAFHGPGTFDRKTGEIQKKGLTYTEVFGKTMVKLGKEDKRIVGITAAMPTGTGLAAFGRAFPDRYFDVGIAEQHAVTFAAGLATQGLRPIVAIYSTFLQRAYDQLIHDVCLQNLPVIFAIDRAGIVGDDGPTHQGVFDLSYLASVPGLVIMAPKDGAELKSMLRSALSYNCPVAIRYPRGKAERGDADVRGETSDKVIPLGKAEVLMEGFTRQVQPEGKDVGILSIGNMVYPGCKAAELLEKDGISCTVVNMRFISPLDKKLLANLGKGVNKIITVEENVLPGGLGAAVNQYFSGSGMKVKNIGLPPKFIEQGPPDFLREKYGLSPEGLARTIKQFIVDGL